MIFTKPHERLFLLAIQNTRDTVIDLNFAWKNAALLPAAEREKILKSPGKQDRRRPVATPQTTTKMHTSTRSLQHAHQHAANRSTHAPFNYIPENCIRSLRKPASSSHARTTSRVQRILPLRSRANTGRGAPIAALSSARYLPASSRPASRTDQCWRVPFAGRFARPAYTPNQPRAVVHRNRCTYFFHVFCQRNPRSVLPPDSTDRSPLRAGIGCKL